MKLIGDVALLHLDNGKANAIDGALLDTLERFVDDAPTIGARALVVTGYDRFFSAGLHLPSVFDLDRPAMRAFITRFSEVMLRLYATPMPLVAAVNGYAMAGGCVLALMADQRFMVDNDARIGLDEVRLGIGLPACVIEPLRATVPPPSLRPIALEGRILSPHEALELDLVDELAPYAELETRAVAKAQALSEIPSAAFAQVKLQLRAPVLAAARQRAVDETERWLDTWFAEPARRRIGDVVARLRNKKT